MSLPNTQPELLPSLFYQF